MGDPAFSVPPQFDQRGAPFTCVHNGRIDIGAYEAQPLLADVNGDHVVDGLDFLLIQTTGGDIAQWNAEYGVSEPASQLAAAATGEDTPADFWLSLPELDADQRDEPLPEYVALEPIDRAFIQGDIQETSDGRDAPLTLPRSSDATDEPVDAELDEALIQGLTPLAIDYRPFGTDSESGVVPVVVRKP